MVKLNIIALIQLILLAQISFAAPINGPDGESQTTRTYHYCSWTEEASLILVRLILHY